MIDAILERATNVLLSLMTLVHLGMEDIYLIGLICSGQFRASRDHQLAKSGEKYGWRSVKQRYFNSLSPHHIIQSDASSIGFLRGSVCSNPLLFSNSGSCQSFSSFASIYFTHTLSLVLFSLALSPSPFF